MQYQTVSLFLLRIYFLISTFKKGLQGGYIYFADMFNMLILNGSQHLYEFAILLWILFTFFAHELKELGAKRAAVGAI